MTERPILFSAPMVRAILEGRKTQTRRVVLHKRNAPPVWATWINHLKQLNMKHEWVDSNLFQWSEEQTAGEPLKKLRRWPSGVVSVKRGFTPEMDYAIPCPHGKQGAHLWVREAWSEVHPCQVVEGRFSIEGRAGIPGPPPVKYRVVYCVDGEYPRVHFGPTEHPYRTACSGDDCQKSHEHPEERWNGWRPSIHMPRWASRITLEVTEVRVERLQDISESDGKAEGYDGREAFLSGDWAKAQVGNPWVWVIAFKRVQTSA
jgi:hypothetical protein